MKYDTFVHRHRDCVQNVITKLSLNTEYIAFIKRKLNETTILWRQISKKSILRDIFPNKTPTSKRKVLSWTTVFSMEVHILSELKFKINNEPFHAFINE